MKPKTVKVFVTFIYEGDNFVYFHLTKPEVYEGSGNRKDFESENEAQICRKVAEKLYGSKLPKTFEDGIVTFNIARVK